MDSSGENKNVEILDAPDKSPFDKNQYRLIRLPNGIKTLLISRNEGTVSSDGNTSTIATISDDVESTDEYLSAVALAIDVGYNSDPPDVQGLAHFVEHMVFMGSEKYPAENELSDFVQKSGGGSNAYTTSDITNFVTSASGKYFSDALDRFSQMFKAPLITKDAMHRERNAIDAEFSLSSSNDTARSRQVLYSLGTENHPSRQFSWGNSKTLIENVDENTLHQKVHDFRKRHYSAHRMCLCLKAALPLDSLQMLAVRHFADIPSNNLPATDFSSSSHLNAFQSRFHEKAYFVKPIKDVKYIDLTWCIESQVKHYRTKPFEFIAKLVADTSSGGLESFLIDKRWCISVVAYSNPRDVFGLFHVTINLTDDGFRHLDDVLEATFAYLKFLQQTGPNERLFREYQTIAENCFRFANERNAEYVAWGCAKNLRLYAPQDVLNGEFLLYEYDAAAIQRAIDILNTRTFNIMVTAQQKYDENVQFDLKEEWFGTEYTETDMPGKWISMWENIKPVTEFSLPAPNPFVADDFTIFHDKTHPIQKYPTKILANDLCELWFRQDDKFLLPHARCYFSFTTPLAMASTKNTCLLHLYENLLRFQLQDTLSLAAVAGIDIAVESHKKGLIVKTGGFNQKLASVVDRITKEMKSLIDNVDDDKIRTTIDAYIRALDERVQYAVADGLTYALVCVHSVSTFEIKQHVRRIQMDDLKTFCRDLWKQMRVIAIMQGNMTEEIAQSIMQTTLTNINCGKIDDPNSMILRGVKMPAGAHYLRIKSTDPKNCAVLNYYEIGARTFRTAVLAGLLRSVCYRLAYNTLRTAEQLGYVVDFRAMDRCGVLAYSITVESKATNFSTDFVDERIEAFRTELLSIIEKLPDVEFEQRKAMMTTSLLSKDKSLRQEVDRNWLEVVSEQRIFDRNHRNAEIIPSVTKEEFVQFYRACYGANERKVSIQLIALPDDPNNRDELIYVDFDKPNAKMLIRNIADFKKELEVHPPPEILPLSSTRL